MSATNTTYLRPRRSANTPASGLAANANRLVVEVIKLLSRVESGCDRSGPMETRVELITPVLQSVSQIGLQKGALPAHSYPNNMPLIPAVTERAQTKALGEVDSVSSETKLPVRSSRLPLGLSGSCMRGCSAAMSSPAIVCVCREVHA